MEFVRPLTVTCLLLVCQIEDAQTQGVRKTMLEQLAALRGYIITAKQGYKIADKGLQLVRNIKSGEFSLHQEFFQSLTSVNEGVLQNPQVDESYRLIAAIDKAFSQAMPTYVNSIWLRPAEMEYIQGMQKQAGKRGRNDLTALESVTEDGILSMTDGERMGSIRAIRTGLQMRYNQVKGFLISVALLIYERQKEQRFIGTLKKWYDIQ